MTRHVFTHVVALILATTFSGCNQQIETINQEFGNLPAALTDSLKQISGQIQTSELDPTRDNTVVGQQGTAIFIPANSLLDGQGIALTTKANIQLKECYSLADIVTSNLQTVHNGDILQTQGMIYLTATTPDGDPVTIDKAKPIRIEMPVSSYIPGTKIFKGVREKNGTMNWVAVEETEKKLIPVPMKTIVPDGTGLGLTQDPRILKHPHARDHYINDDITKYENTLLATREFYARFDSYSSRNLTRIYIANLDKNMWEIDELMVQYMIKDSVEQVKYELNDVPARPDGGKVTKDQEEAHQWLINNAKEDGHERIEMFRKFAAQKLTKIDTRFKADTSRLKEFSASAFVAYEMLEFGWVNADIFFNDPKAKAINLVVQTNGTPSIVNIIFKDKKIILNGIEDGPNKFRFTQNGKGYNKLPKGDTAIILAIGYRDNKITFASKEIITGQNEIEDLDLQEITATELTKHLNSYGD